MAPILILQGASQIQIESVISIEVVGSDSEENLAKLNRGFQSINSGFIRDA